MQTIISYLASLGINLAEKVSDSVQPTEWDHRTNPGMLYHLPSQQIHFIKMLIVKEYESGVFLRDGKLYAVLPPGRWVLSRMPLVGKMEFIWVDTGIKKINFGLRSLTKDGVELGANGVTYLRVSDAEKFVINLATAKELYQSEELESFLRDQVNSIMRAEVANYDVQSLYLERDMFISVARVKFQEMFSDLGLDFRSIEVAGILLPDDVRDSLKKPMMAVREAQATLAIGTVDVQLLKMMKDSGIDPIKMKGAEALMKYAERPGGTGGAPLSGDFLMPMVFYGMLMNDDSISSDIKGQLQQMFPQFNEKQSKEDVKEEQKISLDESANKTQVTNEDIQEILDGLDTRLAKGEISEEIYNKLYAKWESKLNQN